MKTKDAVAYFAQGRRGGKKRLADALGIYLSAIYQWGENVPYERTVQLERITNGDLKADDISDRLVQRVNQYYPEENPPEPPVQPDPTQEGL